MLTKYGKILATCSIVFASAIYGTKVNNRTQFLAEELPSHGAAGTRHERTFMAIKYDAIQRGNIAEILGRLEKKGYKIVGLKMVTPTRQQVEAHYHDLKGRPFFAGLVDYMTGLPLVCICVEGKGVISYSRVMIGATNPLVAPPGTIRGDLSVDVGRNSVHGSDAPETAQYEINLWFKPEEIANYELANAQWTYEK